MSRTFDLLVIGDVNPDAVVGPVPRAMAFGQREQLVERGGLVLGGSAAIMACGAARLGLRVAFAGRVGDDSAGAFVRGALTMEYAPQVIHSVVTGTPRTIYGNVPNRGLIDNLPADSVVEVPCLVDALGVQPTRVGSLPPQCAALNSAYVSVTELVVRAATDGDPRHIRHAAMADPATAAALPVERIWDLCDDLVRAHRELLQPELREELGH